MMDRAQRHGLRLVPHAKTHQSTVVSRWLQEEGVTETAVTSVAMGRALLPAGWAGMTVAMPLDPSPAALRAVNELAAEVPLTVFVNTPAAARSLVAAGHPNIRCLTEIDAGYGRSGIAFTEAAALQELLELLGRERFRGYYTHSGHTYGASSAAAIAEIHQQLLAAIAVVRRYPTTPPGTAFVIGDTPAYSTQEDFRGVTALGPGNFVYYDLVQATLGACQPTDIGVCLSAPVLEVRPGGRQLVLHAGWAQLGNDQLADGSGGWLVALTDDGRWDARRPVGTIIRRSQEHGTARLSPEWAGAFRPGDRVGVLPVHACSLVHGMQATTAPSRIV